MKLHTTISSRMSGESTAAMIQPTVFRSLSFARTLAAILAAAAAEIDKGEVPFHYLVLYGILRLKNKLTDKSEVKEKPIFMKKKILLTLMIIAALLLIYLLGSGFTKNSSVYIDDYTVSEDGSEITMDIGVASSAGYIRDAAVHQQQGGRLYIDCYSAFGGFNGSIGAKTSFTLPLDEDTTTIAIYRSANSYEEVLWKDTNGIWQRKQ